MLVHGVDTHFFSSIAMNDDDDGSNNREYAWGGQQRNDADGEDDDDDDDGGAAGIDREDNDDVADALLMEGRLLSPGRSPIGTDGVAEGIDDDFSVAPSVPMRDPRGDGDDDDDDDTIILENLEEIIMSGDHDDPLLSLLARSSTEGHLQEAESFDASSMICGLIAAEVATTGTTQEDPQQFHVSGPTTNLDAFGASAAGEQNLYHNTDVAPWPSAPERDTGVAEIEAYIGRHYPSLAVSHRSLIARMIAGTMDRQTDLVGDTAASPADAADIGRNWSDLASFVINRRQNDGAEDGHQQQLLLPHSTGNDPDVEAAMAALLEEHFRQTQGGPTREGTTPAEMEAGTSGRPGAGQPSASPLAARDAGGLGREDRPYKRKVKSGPERQPHRCKVCGLPKVTTRHGPDGSVVRIPHLCPDEVGQDGAARVLLKDVATQTDEAEMDRDPPLGDPRVLVAATTWSPTREGDEDPPFQNPPWAIPRESGGTDDPEDDRKPAAKRKRDDIFDRGDDMDADAVDDEDDDGDKGEEEADADPGSLVCSCQVGRNRRSLFAPNPTSPLFKPPFARRRCCLPFM
jgi:hypothetical protein